MGKRAVSVGKELFLWGKSEMRKTPKTLKRTVTNLVSLLSTSDTSTVIRISEVVLSFHPGSARTTTIVLCHIYFFQSAHIVTLCEANDEHGGIAIHQQLASDHSMIGMVANAEITAPSLAIFSRGNHFSVTFIELIGHYQAETSSEEAQNRFWLLHGAIFRLSYGHITSGEIIDPTTGIGTTKPTDVTPNMSAAVKPHPAPLASTQDSPDLFICEIDGRCDAQHADLLRPTSGADTHDIKRLGLAEVHIGVFHIYSYAWSDSYSEACEKWLHVVANCVEHQVGFLSGDGNLFAQRSFKKDDHSDFRTCIMIDILERFLQEINLQRSPLNRISYNVVSSTQASQYLRSMEGESADCDSMLLISLCYGKQTVISEERGKEESASAEEVAGPAIGDEIVLTDVEQLKYLLTYDLGLRETDATWHSPLLA